MSLRRMNAKAQTINGVELSILSPRRARVGRSFNREWLVTAGGVEYTIKGGAAGIGGCGTGFEVSTGGAVLGKYAQLKRAMEVIASLAVL